MAETDADDPCAGGSHCCCCGPGEACCDCGEIVPEADALPCLTCHQPGCDFDCDGPYDEPSDTYSSTKEGA